MPIYIPSTQTLVANASNNNQFRNPSAGYDFWSPVYDPMLDNANQQVPDFVGGAQSPYRDLDPGKSGINGTPYTPGTTGLTYFNDPYKFVFIGGVKSPGYATVNITKNNAIDSKRAPGVSSTLSTFYGQQASEFNITFEIWTYGQWEAFKDLIAPLVGNLTSNGLPTPSQTNAGNPVGSVPSSLKTVGGSKKSPITTIEYTTLFTIQQPELNALGISSFMTKGLVGPEIDLKNQRRKYTLKCVEAFNPTLSQAPNNTSTPTKPVAPLSVPISNDAGQAGPNYKG